MHQLTFFTSATSLRLLLLCLLGMLSFPLQAAPATTSGDSSEVIAAAPLFATDDHLSIRLETNMKELLRDKREERSYHPGTLVYMDGAAEVRIPVSLRIRGNFRRTTCSFPPIRIKFDSAEVVGTLFEGQHKLKLVTHCQKSEIYESYVREEYLLYRTYNQLTKHSFGARFGEIAYIDTRGKMDTLVKPMFFIEPIEQMAAKSGGKLLDVKQVHPNQTDRYQATLMAFFAYMVGNTDWSIPGLHNVRLVIEQPGAAPLCVPYDFDWSGAIAAPYAKPNPQLGISSVQERVFRGFCQDPSVYQAVIDTFQAQKEAIMALYKQMPGLPEKRLERALSYYESFYMILDDPKRLQRDLLNQCRDNR